MSGLPMPRSIMSSPATLSLYFSSFTTWNTYRRKSFDSSEFFHVSLPSALCVVRHFGRKNIPSPRPFQSMCVGTSRANVAPSPILIPGNPSERPLLNPEMRTTKSPTHEEVTRQVSFFFVSCAFVVDSLSLAMNRYHRGSATSSPARMVCASCVRRPGPSYKTRECSMVFRAHGSDLASTHSKHGSPAS